MKCPLFALGLISVLTMSCKASGTQLKSQSSVTCPSEITKGSKLADGAVLLGEPFESKSKLRTVGLIKKSTSRIAERIWDEEILEWDDSAEGSSAVTSFDSTQSDWMLKCSYPGKKTKEKASYLDITVLLPIRERIGVDCKFAKTDNLTSALCEYKTK